MERDSYQIVMLFTDGRRSRWNAFQAERVPGEHSNQKAPCIRRGTNRLRPIPGGTLLRWNAFQVERVPGEHQRIGRPPYWWATVPMDKSPGGQEPMERYPSKLCK